MPGMCGGVAVEPETLETLIREFSSVWGGQIERMALSDGLFAGHSHTGSRVIRSDAETTAMIDGEISAYRYWDSPDWRLDNFCQFEGGGVDLTRECQGNMALYQASTSTLYLITQWSSGFPLYYAEHRGGVLFSSHLRPLARAIGAEPDLVGIIEFLRMGTTFAGRSHYKAIHRMLPGQLISYKADERKFENVDRNKLWLDFRQDVASPDDIADEVWTALSDSLRITIPSDSRCALMLSAGWDSRTLLAASRGMEFFPHLVCYTHGDLNSRELRLARRIASTAGAEARQEPIDEQVLDLGFLQDGFARSENIVFPHWHRAAKLLSADGYDAVFAGVYGAVLGGHHGPSNVMNGWRKGATVMRTLLGGDAAPGDSSDGGYEAAVRLLEVKAFSIPRYMNRDLAAETTNIGAHINEDVSRALRRLRQRGIERYDQLVEAFQSEHRGGQYFHGQLLNCRAHIDIANPLADRRIFQIASALPMKAKIHNIVNRRMLLRHAPDLARFPMAATLLPASAPIWMQEVSRGVRKLSELGVWRLHFVSRGRLAAPHYSWVNFEFLRNGMALTAILDALTSDLWDRPALARMIASVTQSGVKRPMHPVYDQLLKIYTVDLMLRRGSD